MPSLVNTVDMQRGYNEPFHHEVPAYLFDALLSHLQLHADIWNRLEGKNWWLFEFGLDSEMHYSP